jgi:hypothetical protein
MKVANAEFCWKDARGTGLASTKTLVDGVKGGPVALDVSLEKYAAPWVRMKYTCKANALQMVGYIDGVAKWYTSFTRASA